MHIDASGAELKEETGQRRAARSTIQPEYNWVILGIVARLKEPYNGQQIRPRVEGRLHTVE